MNYEHLPVDSPYRMRFAIFVRKGDETYDKIDEVPEQLRKRTLTVRGFDRQGMMLGFELADGRELEQAIEKLFANINAECTCTSPRPAATRRGSSAPRFHACRSERRRISPSLSLHLGWSSVMHEQQLMPTHRRRTYNEQTSRQQGYRWTVVHRVLG